jgi:hypothetical protein
MYETKPSISAGARPASAHAARIAVSASWNSLCGDFPRS